MKVALSNTENRNSLALGLLATGALLATLLEIANESTLRIPLMGLVAIVLTAAVWSAPRGRRAHRLSKRYRGMMSRVYRWPLIILGLAGCALYSLGWFWASGDGLKIGMALLGFFCLQSVAIALSLPLGRRLQPSSDEPHAASTKPA